MTRSALCASAVGLATARRAFESPQNLHLSQEDGLLEVDRRWQALSCRGHLELLPAP
jgi:hypothetical protein